MRLLLVEDERELTDTLAAGLRHEGYAVDTAYDGGEALALLAGADYELLILDRDLPVMSGDMICRTLRAQGHPVHILMLTAADTLDDLVTGLDLGADDYLSKPFSYVELLARLRAQARRTIPGAGTVISASGVRLDTIRRTAEREGRPLRLTRKELGILEALLAARGGYVTAEELLDDIWDSDRNRGVVKAAMHTLRQKLGAPDVIESVPGIGYRIEVD